MLDQFEKPPRILGVQCHTLFKKPKASLMGVQLQVATGSQVVLILYCRSACQLDAVVSSTCRHVYGPLRPVNGVKIANILKGRVNGCRLHRRRQVRTCLTPVSIYRGPDLLP